MKKKTIISTIILLVIAILIVLLAYSINTPKNIPQDYFAVFNTKDPNNCSYKVYLYMDNKTQAEYIVTYTPANFAGESGNTKIIKKDSLKYPQDIFDIKITYNNVTIKVNGDITINKDISETSWHKEYKKGDSIGVQELWNLIAIN